MSTEYKDKFNTIHFIKYPRKMNTMGVSVATQGNKVSQYQCHDVHKFQSIRIGFKNRDRENRIVLYRYT